MANNSNYQKIAQLVAQVSFLESELQSYESLISSVTLEMTKAQSKSDKGTRASHNLLSVTKNRVKASSKKRELNRLRDSASAVQSSLVGKREEIRRLQSQNLSTTDTNTR